MPSARLTPLQERVLVLLAEVTPPWTLTGGGALVTSVPDMAPVDALTPQELAELVEFKEELVAKLTRAASPE